ncbi:pentapeptide repeat-containing protein [Novosphingobium sp. JCM 18896]|uniref:anti-phage Hailong system effector protein HalA n=1 Tax=Novosphingobium sp. JCM 18896 TaxID=2989731 RepID=UPI002221F773|nr:pentapeptide repeat-containing protein [Novosphingobium sp. JCM 18896]MCW1431577.1 pentapeptide repeat-containing protein [Novosphingobium sp. JCM 18896]
MGEIKTDRRRRETCWWEPTYDPDLVGKLAEGVWDFAHARGPTRCFFRDDGYQDAAKASRHKFSDVTFTDCDFGGFFVLEIQVAFNGCTFVNCDFGLTTWKNVKFSNCKFTKCSFGQTVFTNCEFRGCKWADIGLSPNMLELNSTYISNASELISAAYTNLDESVLSNKKVRREDQVVKLEHTKATISRRILRNLQEEGDEGAFYDAVKTFQIQQARARRFQARQDTADNPGILLSRSRLLHLSWTTEEFILKIIGKLNDWGASIVRPLAMTIALTVLMSCIYNWLCTPQIFPHAALQRSFDITILAGYSNYGSEKDKLTYFIQNLHVALATLFHAITFTTIVTRLVRVR